MSTMQSGFYEIQFSREVLDIPHSYINVSVFIYCAVSCCAMLLHCLHSFETDSDSLGVRLYELLSGDHFPKLWTT